MFLPDQQQQEIFHWYKWDSACFFQCLHHHWSQLWSSLGISSFHDNTSQEGLRPWMSGISLHQQTQRKGRRSCCPVSVKEDTFLSTDQDSQYNYLRIHWFLRLPKMNLELRKGKTWVKQRSGHHNRLGKMMQNTRLLSLGASSYKDNLSLIDNTVLLYEYDWVKFLQGWKWYTLYALFYFSRVSTCSMIACTGVVIQLIRPIRHRW